MPRPPWLHPTTGHHQQGSKSSNEENDHGGVGRGTDGVIAGTERLIVREDGAIVVEEQPAVTTTGAVKEEDGGRGGTGVGFEIDHVLLHHPYGGPQVTTLFEENADGTVVQNLGRLEAIVCSLPW